MLAKLDGENQMPFLFSSALGCWVWFDSGGLLDQSHDLTHGTMVDEIIRFAEPIIIADGIRNNSEVNEVNMINNALRK